MLRELRYPGAVPDPERPELISAGAAGQAGAAEKMF